MVKRLKERSGLFRLFYGRFGDVLGTFLGILRAFRVFKAVLCLNSVVSVLSKILLYSFTNTDDFCSAFDLIQPVQIVPFISILAVINIVSIAVTEIVSRSLFIEHRAHLTSMIPAVNNFVIRAELLFHDLIHERIFVSIKGDGLLWFHPVFTSTSGCVLSA